MEREAFPGELRLLQLWQQLWTCQLAYKATHPPRPEPAPTLFLYTMSPPFATNKEVVAKARGQEPPRRPSRDIAVDRRVKTRHGPSGSRGGVETAHLEDSKDTRLSTNVEWDERHLGRGTASWPQLRSHQARHTLGTNTSPRMVPPAALFPLMGLKPASTRMFSPTMRPYRTRPGLS